MAQNVHLSASLMCARQDALGEEVQALDTAGIDAFHLDLMDGHFVPNLSLSPDTVAAIRARTQLPLEVHLMVEHPEQYLSALSEAGADLVFFHVETTDNPASVADLIVDHGMRAGLAVGPEAHLPERSDMGPAAEVLVMAVTPGFSGGAWLPATPQRISACAALLGTAATIHVDGHVDLATAPASLAAGASGFVCGTRSLFCSDAQSYAERLAALRAVLVGGSNLAIAAASPARAATPTTGPT